MSSPINTVVLCGNVLSSLWFISTRMRISLGVVRLKSVFCVCTNPLRTPHGLTKKKIKLNHRIHR